MPNYLVELEDGRKFQVEADTPPTREELSQYLAEQQSTQSAVPQAKKDIPFLDITDVASSLGQAATSLATTVPASFGQMYEGTMNPWQKGADSIERQKAMRDVQRQAELSQAEAEASGEASVASRAIRSGIPSYGFTGAIMPPSLIAGGVTGLATAAATRNPVAAQRAAMAAGTAASGYAAYRMASAQFLDDARERIDNFFLEKAGRLPNEQEQEEAYQELLPLAQEMGMAEALPEAFGNLALAGAGKYIYRILGGKTGVQQLASGALSKVKGLDALKSVGAGVAGTGAELTTEGVTEVLQESPYTKLEEGVMRGVPVESVQTEPFTLQRLGEGIERVAEPTLATTLLMGGLGAVGTAGYRRATRKDFEQNDFRDKMIQQAVTARRAMTDAGVTETDKTNLTNRAEEAEAALKALDEGRSSDVEQYFNVRLVKPAVSPAIDVANKLNSVSSSNPDATQAAAAAQADIDKANADADAKRVADEQAAAAAAVTAPTPITLAPESEPIAEPPTPSPLTGQAAAPAAEELPPAPVAESPSPNLPPRATENVEPIPTRKEGESRQDFLDRKDAWMEQYGFMRKGGRTHNDDGTPYQPTVFDEVLPNILAAKSQMTDDEASERIGDSGEVSIASSVRTLLNAGWTWDAENQRWQQPENNPVPNESPLNAILRLQGKTQNVVPSTAPTATPQPPASAATPVAAETQTPTPTTPDATIQGEIPEDGQQERVQTDEGRSPAETGGGYSPVVGRQVEAEEEVAPSRKAQVVNSVFAAIQSHLAGGGEFQIPGNPPLRITPKNANQFSVSKDGDLVFSRGKKGGVIPVTDVAAIGSQVGAPFDVLSLFEETPVEQPTVNDALVIAESDNGESFDRLSALIGDRQKAANEIETLTGMDVFSVWPIVVDAVADSVSVSNGQFVDTEAKAEKLRSLYREAQAMPASIERANAIEQITLASNINQSNRDSIKRKKIAQPPAAAVSQAPQPSPKAEEAVISRVAHETDTMPLKDLVSWAESQGIQRDAALEYANDLTKSWAKKVVDRANAIFNRKVELGFFPAKISKDGKRIVATGVGLNRGNRVEVDHYKSPIHAAWVAAHEFSHSLFPTSLIKEDIPVALRSKFVGEVPAGLESAEKSLQERVAVDFANWLSPQIFPEHAGLFPKVNTDVASFFEAAKQAPQPSPNLPALIAVRDNTATPEQVQSLVDQGLVERVGDQNIITEAGVAAMPEGEKPKLTPAERAAEVEGMAAPVVRDVTKPEQMTPEEFDAAIQSVNRKTSDKNTIEDLKIAEPIIEMLDDATQPGPEMGGMGPTPQIRKMLQDAGYVERAKAKRGRLTEKGRNELSELKKSVRGFQDKRANLQDEIADNLPVSASAVDTYGITLPEGYVKQGDLYVFQPEAPAAQPPAAEPVTPEVTPEAASQQKKDEKEAKKLENESRASLARLVAGERGNPVFGNVTMDDGIEALRQLDEAGDLPNIFFTEITTTQEFLSKPENEQNFPDTWAALSAGGKAEGMEEKGTAFVFIDNVGVTNLDRKLATQFGTTPEVAAVRRVAVHESIHKAISFLNESEQIALFRYMRELYSPEQLDVLAETYTNFANWRESKSSYLNLIEESLTRTIDSMDSLPKDGILGEFIQWLKGIWRKITGKKGEPTLNDMKDVMRLIRNGLRNSTKARADRTISGGVVRYSAFAPQAPATDAEYLAAVEAGDSGNDNLNQLLLDASPDERQAVVDSWIKRNPKAAARMQEIVAEAAKAAGFKTKAYHKTWESFTEFIQGGNLQETRQWLGKNGNIRTLIGKSGKGFFFSLDRENTPAYHNQKKTGEKILDVYLKYRNPLVFDKDTKEWAIAVFGDGNPEFPRILTNEAYDFVKQDYDSVELYNKGYAHESKPDEVIVLDPNQIKSADPVTYNDQGRIIPLSQRFQTTSPDIRFSLPTLVSESASAFSSGQQAARAISFTPRQLDVYMAVLGAFSTLRRKGKQSATMQELFDAANTLVSGITPNEFSETLQGLYNDNAALLNPGDSTFQVFNRDGELAGAVVLVAKDTSRASLIPPEEIKGITDKLTSDMDKAVTEGEQSPFEGLSFTGNVPKMHARVNFRNVEKAAEDFVNQMIRSRKEKGRTYIEALIDIADMVATDNFAKEYIGGAGMESQGLVLQAVPPPLNNKIYAAQMTNISEADRVRLEDAYRKVSLYYEGIGTVGGTLQGYRAWTATRGKYGWLLDSWKADALKTAEYAVNAQMGGSVSVKINQDLNDAVTGVGKAVADEVSGIVEEDAEMELLREGEAELNEEEKGLWSRAKMLLRRLAMYARRKTIKAASAARASLSKAEIDELNAILLMSDEEAEKEEAKDRAELKSVLKQLLGEDKPTDTPAEKAKKGKLKGMVKAAEKIIFREGKDVEFRKTSAQEAVADLFNGADEYGKIVEEVGNALLSRVKQAKGMGGGQTAIKQLVESIKKNLLGNLPTPKPAPPTNATLGKMLAMTFSQQIREARLYADAWSKGRTEVRNLLAETGLEGEALENELDAIMPPTPTLAYAPNAAKRAIALAMEQAGVTREELTDARVNVSNEAKAKVMAAFDAAAAAANLSTEGWNTQGATGRQLAERALNEAVQQWIIQAETRALEEIEIAENKASQIIYRFEEQFRQGFKNPPEGMTGKEQRDSIIRAFRDQVKNPISFEAFAERLAKLKVGNEIAERMFLTASRERADLIRVKDLKIVNRKVEIASKQASRLIYNTEERLRQGSKDLEESKNGDSINKAFRDQISKPVSEKEFRQRLEKLNVPSDVAARLFKTAAREKADLEAMAQWRANERLISKRLDAEVSDIVAEQADNPVSIEAFTKKLSQFNLTPKQVKRYFDIAARAAVRRVEINNEKAKRIIYERGDIRPDVAEKDVDGDTVIEAFRDQVNSPTEEQAFLERLSKLRVAENVAKDLFNTAARERRDRQRTRVFDMIEGKNGIQRMLREIALARRGIEMPLRNPIPWTELLSKPAKSVDEYRQRVLDGILANPDMESVDNDVKERIADMFTDLWQEQVDKAVNRVIDNYTLQLDRAQRRQAGEALNKSRSKVIQHLNLGVLSNDAFIRILGEKFGIKMEMTKEERKHIESLLATLQDESLPKNKRNQASDDLASALMQYTKVGWSARLSLFWAMSVLAGWNTMLAIGMSFMNGANIILVRTPIGILSKMAQGDFKGALDVTFDSLNDMKRYLEAFPEAVDRAWGYITSGKVDLLEAEAAAPDRLFKSWDSLAKYRKVADQMVQDPKMLVRWMGTFMRMIGRIMTALDGFNTIVTKRGHLSMAVRLVAPDKEAFDRIIAKGSIEHYRQMLLASDPYFANMTPEKRRLLNSTAEAMMYQAMNEEGAKLENADFYASESAFTMDPSGIGGMIYGAIKKAEETSKSFAERNLAEKRLEAQGADRLSLENAKLATAYITHFLAYNAVNYVGLRFARFAANKFNQGLSFIPFLGLTRFWEKSNSRLVDRQEAFTEMIYRNQAVGAVFAILGAMLIRALDEEPDDEKRGWFINGGLENVPTAQRRQLQEGGKLQYRLGVKINGRWLVFSYQNWPWSQLFSALGSTSDMIRFSPEKWREKGTSDILLSVAASGLTSTLDLPALQGLGTVLGRSISSSDPAEDFWTNIGAASANWVGGFIPKPLMDLDYILDSNRRKYTTIWEKTAGVVPFYRRYVGEDYYNILGDPIKRNALPGSREFLLGPTEPAYKILGALNSRDIWLTPANAEQRMVGKGRNRRRLTQQEADAYSLETGKAYKAMILRYGPRALQMSPERARAFLSDKADEVRDRVLMKVYRGYRSRPSAP